ncbi:MAG: energy-coupling factor transporter ATPase [Clostridiales bacterium]|nr:energy-coupling factor transporter ATPase [Clostridiales bacterium]
MNPQTRDISEYAVAVEAEDILFSYPTNSGSKVVAVDHASFSVKRGEYVAILGRNGSGKSTLAKMVNLLEFPDNGKLSVFELDASSDENFWSIRSHCGMVFQNPDNQIVGTTVEEDVAFGPENLSVPLPELAQRVEKALGYVGLLEMAERQPSSLSGGQKQKLAIAGVLAMQPQLLILDESTSMLDPKSRDEFLQLVGRMRHDKGITVLHITHDMHEAFLADRVIVLEKGKIRLNGTPPEVFSQVDVIRELGLELPKWAELLYEVARIYGIETKESDFVSEKIAIAKIKEILKSPIPERTVKEKLPTHTVSEKVMLRVSDLAYSYDKKGRKTISDISFDVKKGEIVAVIGHSGSGKTTLISQLNGILRPLEGKVEVWDEGEQTYISTDKNADIRKIRKHVGLLFQYPEYQLFEETVAKDIQFGPKKMGYNDKECDRLMHEALPLVGLSEDVLDRSPFELSGGQKRRVAFAGILAMAPDVLILDEPAAGLDPAGQKEIFGYIETLRDQGKSIVLVSHDMDEAARIADRILVLKKGRQEFFGTPENLFSSEHEYLAMRLDCPCLIKTMLELAKERPDLNPFLFDVKEAAQALVFGEAAATSTEDCRRVSSSDEGAEEVEES